MPPAARPSPALPPSAPPRFHFDGAAGWYTLRVQYFDQDNGVSHFRLLVGAQTVDEWDADDHLPSRKLDGAASSRRRVGP